MPFDLENARRLATSLEAMLRPIAKTRFEGTDAHSLEEFLNELTRLAPLDRIGARAEAETLMTDLVLAYYSGDSGLRTSIRLLLADTPSFAWATGIPDSPATVEGFRNQLLCLSAKDRLVDFRDKIMSVQELCMKARSAGVVTAGVLREVAALSSDEDGADSTKRIFLSAC
jgi:hypothetical protein